MINLAGSGANAAPQEPADVYDQAMLPAVVNLVDAQVLQTRHALEILAQTSEVQSGRWERMQSLMHAAVPKQLPQIFWFALPDGSYYTTEKGKVPQTLIDKPFFARLLAGHPVLNELSVSRSTGRKAFVNALPVKAKGRIIGAVGASMFVDDFSRFLTDALKLPSSAIFYGLDPTGMTAFHVNPGLDFLAPGAQGSPTLTNATHHMLAHHSGVVTYEFQGTNRRVSFTTSPVTGWKVAFGHILGPAAALPRRQ